MKRRVFLGVLLGLSVIPIVARCLPKEKHISPIDGWISVKEKMPNRGDMCKIKLTIPYGYNNNEFSSRHVKDEEYVGMFGIHDNEDIEELRGIVEDIILEGSTNYYWSGLRRDIPQFVTHWKLVNE